MSVHLVMLNDFRFALRLLRTNPGITIGLCGSLATARLVSSLLVGVNAQDPWTFAGVSLVLMIVGAAASYVPARRATRVDPMIALRHE